MQKPKVKYAKILERLLDNTCTFLARLNRRRHKTY